MKSPSLERNTATQSNRAVLILQVLFILVCSLWRIVQGRAPTIESLALLAVVALLWGRRQRAMLLDLAPFFLLLATYQGLRSFADEIALTEVHVTDLIAWEKALCGWIIPARFVQLYLTGQPYTALLDKVLLAVYMSHFVWPVVVAIALWLRRRGDYWLFVLGLLALSYAGFATYILFPAAPPWWATYHGYLMEQPVLMRPYGPGMVSRIPNPVAAMPSLHMAYQVYIVAYCLWVWRKKALAMLVMPVLMAFTTLYLGHHYVIDLLAGIVYGLAFFALTLLFRRTPRRRVAPQAQALEPEGVTEGC
ncbi:MAG: inositol phosphorylceramide synthase [Chloroflexi bacterium]|nr:inositol phosphorylceramide synthase [Chloroflexota bacterium]